MELKRILANDAKTANDRAMSLYGRDVLIISSHSVGGQTELIVALDIEEQAPESVVTVTRPNVPLAEPTVSFGSQMALVSADTKGGMTAAAATAGPLPAKKADISLARPEPVSIQPGGQFDREVMDQILDELKSLRREVSLNQKISGWHSNLDLAPEVENLLTSFTHAGMPTGLRTLLVDTVKDMRSEKEALDAVRHQLEQVVHRPSAALPTSGIHLVAGPSGTGKTLMVVRLASHAAAQVGAGRVAMVSYRDLRLGAWPQTLSMAREAGVECFRADTTEALSTVLAALSGYSLILIDTSGNQLSQRVTEIQSVCPSCLAHAMVAADSPARELLVRLEVEPTAICIHVTDTGPGIPAEKHAEIFRPYVTGRKGGSGLGLAVTRRIIEEHGGRIDIYSELGKGSDFAVRLPIAGPSETPNTGDDDDARKTILDRLFKRAERTSLAITPALSGPSGPPAHSNQSFAFKRSGT